MKQHVPVDGTDHETVLACGALLFDLDGVLVDSLAAIIRAMSAWAAERGLDPDTVVRLSHGKRDVDLIASVAPHLDPQREALRIQEHDEREMPSLRPVPGAAALIAALPQDRWAIVTSGSSRIARARLAAAGLPEPSNLVTADSVERGKPDAQGYRIAAARLGVEAWDCVVVEDAPSGWEAARRGGMACVAVGQATEDPRVTASVRDLRQVRAAVDADTGGLVVRIGGGPGGTHQPARPRPVAELNGIRGEDGNSC
ncbi:HAD-IA family hydrolase [Streptomonospora sp. PA3]|uniref:HAD-IA family hydrolase n=1 Tax=Streptomonospora sp. PA3 TaxID=2607326 RepID=UPI0012DD1851|nr:HAD-IA family hydrolase [Streptomonospora sp. PA3]MUL43186.1 HAD-IA family hydrolase [Streptomonospora sp. PA3]